MARAERLGRQSRHGQSAPCAIGRFRLIEPEVPRPEGHILPHSRHEELVVGILEDETDPTPDLSDVDIVQFETAHRDRPGASQDPVQVKSQCRLPGSIRSEQRDPPAFLNREIDAGESRPAVRV